MTLLSRALFWTGLVLTICSCQTWKFTSAQPQKVSENFVALCPTHGELDEIDLRQIQSWNVRSIRQGFFWGSVEPRRGQWDFSWTDRYVENAQKVHSEVLAVLDYDVGWLNYAESERPRVKPEDLPLFLEYVEKVVARYKGRPVSFEIWNEPNLSIFWKGSKAEFMDLVRQTIRRIRSVNPDAQIVVGSLSQSPSDWLNDMLDLYSQTPYDALSFHPYDLNEDWSVNQIVRVKQELAKRKIDIDILLTEVGYPTRGWYVTKTDFFGQSDRLVKTYVSSAALGVKQVFWYASQDYNNSDKVDDNSEAYFGISYPDGTEKPAAKAYSLMAQFLNSSFFLGEIPSLSASSIASFRFDKPDKTSVLILWSRSVGSSQVVFGKGIGKIVDPYTLTEIPVEARVPIPVGAKPVIIKLNANESPLLDEIASVVQVF